MKDYTNTCRGVYFRFLQCSFRSIFCFFCINRIFNV